MGASNSSANPHGSSEDEDPQQPNRNNNNNSNRPIGTAIAIAAGATVAAWGISRMSSNNTERNHHETTPSSSSMSSMILEAININNNQGPREVWSPPSQGRYKVNTDGACRPVRIDHSDGGVQRGPSGYGGILRDHQGIWVRGFIGFIGESDCLTSEFYGILKGLELLDKLKLKGSILETDCKGAQEWVTGERDDPGRSQIIGACWPMIIRCRQLAVKNDVEINLILGDDANRCADKLADMAIERKEVYMEINDVPSNLRSLVEIDANNYYYSY